jgi:hypothetical protein
MNTAIFSLINAVLFRALPVSHPEELVLLRWHARQPAQRSALHSHSSHGDCPQHRQGENPNGCSFSLPFLNLLRSQGTVLSGLAAFSGAPRLDLSGNGAATIVNNGQLVSGDYFATLGVKAAVGRTLQPSDDTPGAAPVLVLSYSYWQSAFGGLPNAVGRTVKLNGLPFTIVGVAEPKFTGLAPGQEFNLWLPLSVRASLTPIGAARLRISQRIDLRVRFTRAKVVALADDGTLFDDDAADSRVGRRRVESAFG